MSHRPDVEELILHTVKDHGCDNARALLEVIKQQSIVDASAQTLATPSPRVIDITDVVADGLYERLPEFHALHDEHHVAPLYEKITEERKATHG